MMIEIKSKTEQGDIIFEGNLNKKEVGFLLMYAINDLMQAGVQFNLNLPTLVPNTEEEAMRINFPTGVLN